MAESHSEGASQPINPYAPTHVATDFAPSTDAESIREKFLSHEASVKSIGLLYILGAIFLIPMGLMSAGAILFSIGSGKLELRAALALASISLFYLGFGALQLLVAFGLQRLRPWSRIVGIGFAVIGLLAIPLGTIIAAYILYLLASKKGRFVCSEEYRQIIEQTPHIKYRTSRFVWVMLLILLGLLVLGVVIALTSGLR